MYVLCMYVYMYVCMYVCMYVGNGVMIEIYGFTHRLCAFLACDADDAIAMEVEVKESENRRRHQNKSRDIEEINCSTKG